MHAASSSGCMHAPPSTGARPMGMRNNNSKQADASKHSLTPSRHAPLCRTLSPPQSCAGFARVLAYLTSLGVYTLVAAPFKSSRYLPGQLPDLRADPLAAACHAALQWSPQQELPRVAGAAQAGSGAGAWAAGSYAGARAGGSEAGACAGTACEQQSGSGSSSSSGAEVAGQRAGWQQQGVAWHGDGSSDGNQLAESAGAGAAAGRSHSRGTRSPSRPVSPAAAGQRLRGAVTGVWLNPKCVTTKS